MADDATLTIRFRDEGSPGAGAGTMGPQPSGTAAPTDFVQATQQAITAAGGVGAYTTRAGGVSVSPVAPVIVSPAAGTAAPPTATVTTTSADPQEAMLQTFMQRLAAQEGNKPAETLLAMGVPPEDVVNALQRTRLLNVPTEPLHDRDYRDAILKEEADARDAASMSAVSKEYDAELRRIQQQERAEEMAARQRQLDELNRVLDEAKYNMPRPAPLTREQMLDEAARIAPPIQGEEEPGRDPYERPNIGPLNNALNQITGLASYAGPEGAIVSQIGRTVSPFIAEAGGAIGLAGAAAAGIGVVAAGVAGSMATVAAIDSYVNSKTEQMAPVSGAITVAKAHAEVREFMRTLDSANKLGELAAVNIDAGQRLADNTKEFRDTFAAYAEAFTATLKGGIADLMKGKWFTPEGLEEQKKINQKLREALDKIAEGNVLGNVPTYKPGDLLFIVPELMDPFAKWRNAAAKNPKGLTPTPFGDPNYSSGGEFGMW